MNARPTMTPERFRRLHFANHPRVQPSDLKRFIDVAEGRLAVSEAFPARNRRRAGTGQRRRLLECQCQQTDGMGVDDSGIVLQGVRILGSNSLNRRRYTKEAMAAALPMYAGAKCYLDHPDSPQKNRSVKDLIGVLSDPAPDNNGLSGTLTLNPAHPYAGAVAWLARNRPEAIGLSHNAVGEGVTDEDGVFVVRKIVAVRSVDLVVDPATVKGLFS